MDPPRRKKKGTAAKKKKKAGPDVVLIAKLLHTVDAKTIDKVLRSSGGSGRKAGRKAGRGYRWTFRETTTVLGRTTKAHRISDFRIGFWL